MAFVFEQPRWPRTAADSSPGPGSHSPQLVLEPSLKLKDQSKTKIKKGAVFKKPHRFNQNDDQDVSIGVVTPQTGSKRGQHSKNIKSKVNTSTKETKEELTIKQQSWAKTSSFQIQESIQNNKTIQFLGMSPKKQEKKQKSSKKVFMPPRNHFDFDALCLKKTTASIKSYTTQFFYIGSKDHKDSNQGMKHIRTSSGTFNRAYLQTRWQKGKNEQLTSKNQINQQQFQNFQKQKVHKPISAKHPFHRKQNLYADSCQTDQSKCEQKSTGIFSQTNNQQESQFIENALPGPGEYQVDSYHNFKKNNKKHLMFMEKNKNRFQSGQQNLIQKQDFYYTQKPYSRNSKSRAKQNRVGFDKCLQKDKVLLKNKSQGLLYENIQNQQEPNQYYENYESIENKCLKVKLRDALSPGSFNSKNPRFCSPSSQNKYQIEDPITQKQIEQSQKLQKLKKQFRDHNLHPFMSNTPKNYVVSSQKITSTVDYAGQYANTIQAKVDTMLDNDTDYQFMRKQTTEPVIKAPLNTVKTNVEIKHQLVQSIYGYRQQQNLIPNKKHTKGYTFGNSVPIQNKQNLPDPTMYHTRKDWNKNTFNLKFTADLTDDDLQLKKKKNQKIETCAANSVLFGMTIKKQSNF